MRPRELNGTYSFNRVLCPQSEEETSTPSLMELQLPLGAFCCILKLETVVLEAESQSLIEDKRKEEESRSCIELLSKELRLSSLSTDKNNFSKYFQNHSNILITLVNRVTTRFPIGAQTFEGTWMPMQDQTWVIHKLAYKFWRM